MENKILNLNDMVSVYNEMFCVVNASASADVCYTFEPMSDDYVPFVVEMPFSEVKGINSRSALFREGYLRFFIDNPEKEAQVYQSLHINDYKNILTNAEIKDIILNPDKERLEKILAITSSSYFERVRGVYYALKSCKAYDISMRVCELIEARYAELLCNKAKTSLKVVAVEDSKQNEVNALKAEIESLKAQLKTQTTKKNTKKTTEITEQNTETE